MSDPINQEQNKNPDFIRVIQAVNALAEHFDCVEILVSRHENGVANGTMHISYGAGNWFARYGQVRQWLIQQDQAGRNMVDENQKLL